MDHINQTIRILIVEDNDSMREAMSQILQNAGFEAETASDGPDGLDKFRKQEWDLVITDYKLPGLDGLTLLKECKAGEFVIGDAWRSR